MTLYLSVKQSVWEQLERFLGASVAFATGAKSGRKEQKWLRLALGAFSCWRSASLRASLRQQGIIFFCVFTARVNSCPDTCRAKTFYCPVICWIRYSVRGRLCSGKS